MNVSIMQPYLFPYIGYFQLMAVSDVFVVYDDVQYIKGGWINRNRVLTDRGAALITLPVASAPHTLAINQRRYVDDPQARRRWLRRIESLYRRAPRFDHVFELLEGVMSHADRNVAAFNANALCTVAAEIGITTPIRRSSVVAPREGVGGAERVIAISRSLGAERYVNPVGGVSLYDAEDFRRESVRLAFLVPRPREYPQFGAPHVPFLSIIDVLMFNEPGAVQEMLGDFELDER